MKLKLPHGVNYGEGPDGKRVCTGAKLGHANQLPKDTNAPVKLYLVKMRISRDGYDQSGAYWGTPLPSYGVSLYCAWQVDILVFKWARNRKEAKSLVREILPAATFYH